MKVHITPKGHGTTWRRVLGFFFRCGEFTNAHHGAGVVTMAAQCRKPILHGGSHEFLLPDGWEVGA